MSIEFSKLPLTHSMCLCGRTHMRGNNGVRERRCGTSAVHNCTFKRVDSFSVAHWHIHVRLTILWQELDIKPEVWNFCLPLLAVREITQTLLTCSISPPSALANILVGWCIVKCRWLQLLKLWYIVKCRDLSGSERLKQRCLNWFAKA